MKLIISCFILFFDYGHGAFDKFENEFCETLSDEIGICLEGKNCESFWTQRNDLKICSFNGKIPIVCCPMNKGRYSYVEKKISAQKCDEYSEIFKNPPAPKEEGEYGILVVGGKKAEFYEFPHMSAIGWTRRNNKVDWLCGGSLISEKFVLSAAHCTLLGRKRPDVIRIGDLDLLKDEDEIKPQDFKIGNIFIHPQYRNDLKYHDIALFELEIPAIFTNGVSPACLHQSSDDPEETVEAIGYGQTSFAGPQSNILLKGFLDIVNNSDCNEAYEHDSDLVQGITDMQICAWDPYGDRDTCQGDSGGPLQITKFTKTNKKYYEIVGVTSFGKFCAAGSPGVYVRVYSYLDWIESIVWK